MHWMQTAITFTIKLSIYTYTDNVDFIAQHFWYYFIMSNFILFCVKPVSKYNAYRYYTSLNSLYALSAIQ